MPKPRRTWTIPEVVNDAVSNLRAGNARLYTLQSGEQFDEESMVSMLNSHPKANGRTFSAEYADNAKKTIRVKCVSGGGFMDEIQAFGKGILDEVVSLLR